MRTPRGKVAGLLLALALAGTSELGAQVGNITPPWPGWLPQDRVQPTISVTATYDSAAALWRYAYVFANGAAAEQDINKVDLNFNVEAAAAAAPTGWRGLIPLPGALFRAMIHETFTGNFWPPSDYQIRPGTSLGGFSLESPYPPGYARTYVQGYAPSAFEPDPMVDPDAYYAAGPAPHDSINSQRMWTLGPTRYPQVLTPGPPDGVNANGFLGFMNLALVGTTLMNPAPIALKFSLDGEVVYRETLKVLLNGIDVTAAFHPGPADGADLVGVFTLDALPLVEGPNHLVTTVEGVVSASGQRATDTDVIDFLVRR